MHPRTTARNSAKGRANGEGDKRGRSAFGKLASHSRRAALTLALSRRERGPNYSLLSLLRRSFSSISSTVVFVSSDVALLLVDADAGGTLNDQLHDHVVELDDARAEVSVEHHAAPAGSVLRVPRG